MDALEDAVCDTRGSVIVAGDFNAKAVEWGMGWTCSRGRSVTEMTARQDLVVLNTGSSPTFRRAGNQGTIIDISLASPAVAARCHGWKVLEDFTASDHQYISFRLESRSIRERVQRKRGCPRGWNLAKLDRSKLLEELQNLDGQLCPQDENTREEASVEVAERLVNQLTRAVTKSCDLSMPKRFQNPPRRPVYWWNDEIAELRARALSLRRIAQRQRRRDAPTWSAAREEYVAARKELGKAIKASKRQCWWDLCKEIDEDVWGRGYQIVIKCFGKQAPVFPQDPATMQSIVETLFPKHEQRQRSVINVDEPIPLFDVDELQVAAEGMRNRKAPGPDGIPAEIFKIVAEVQPNALLKVFNTCLSAGVFVRRWKVQRLVLIDKGKGPPVTPSSFRPLCMLDSAGKLYERMIRLRLRDAVQEAGGLSDNQHGFRAGRSTTGAINTVVEAAQRAWQGDHRTREFCAVVALDIKNAFNSARWVDILDALGSQFKVPAYLLRVIDDYLSDRKLIYETTRGSRRMNVTAGVAQGSALGPDLWNILYDGVLRIRLPPFARMVAFADDLILIIMARDADQARRRIQYVVELVRAWLEKHGLQLATHKTEMVVLTRQRRLKEPLSVELGDGHVTASSSIRYLGLRVDAKLTFWPHIKEVTERAARVVSALSRLMPNVNGPLSSKRRVMMSVVHSIMLYGAEVWADALDVSTYRKRMASVQRQAALRVACAYRTVSETAVLVVSSVVPIDLLAKERRRMYNRRLEELPLPNIRTEERERTIAAWDSRLQNAQTGRWTARLIRDLSQWVNRSHGEVNFYLTQFLTGHGMFNAYLFKYGRRDSPACDYCPEEEDDVCHTFFSCSRWAVMLHELGNGLEVDISPENVVALMLSSNENWDAVARFVERVLRTKKREEPFREEMQQRVQVATSGG